MITIDFDTRKNLLFYNKKFIYADYTGTGQPSPLIDNYLNTNVYPYYANTHSNSLWSTIMTNQIKNSREYIRKKMNLRDDQKIIFTGNGTTGAINHLVNSLNYVKYNNINIIISLYEHHSNYLPWIEKSKLYSNMKIYIIPLKDGIIDYEWYTDLLTKLNPNDLNITSITGCSNVSGIITDIKNIRNIINRILGPNGLLFVDYACLAPYKYIDASLSNACFISPHKFIGGITTPGLLIADEKLFMNKCPYAPGGGCVKQADDTEIIYEDNIETKESGGTPNIIGIIRIKLVLMIKDIYFDVIQTNEKFITYYVHDKLKNLVSRIPNLTVLYLNKHLHHRLPIVCISISGCHYNAIVKILSNLFGIQTRGGISCCGIFARHIKKTMNIDGWCRISFHWLMTFDEINYILNAIENIAFNHKNLENYKI